MTTNGGRQAGAGTRTAQGGIGSPISNAAYNVIAALQAKLEWMEAFRKYEQSGENTQLWRELNQLDERAVSLLTQELERLTQRGELRLREPGKAS